MNKKPDRQPVRHSTDQEESLGISKPPAMIIAMNDPAFVADAQKQRITVKEVTGETVVRILKDSYAMPPAVIKDAKESMVLSGG